MVIGFLLKFQPIAVSAITYLCGLHRWYVRFLSYIRSISTNRFRRRFYIIIIIYQHFIIIFLCNRAACAYHYFTHSWCINKVKTNLSRAQNLLNYVSFRMLIYIARLSFYWKYNLYSNLYISHKIMEKISRL